MLKYGELKRALFRQRLPESEWAFLLPHFDMNSTLFNTIDGSNLSQIPFATLQCRKFPTKIRPKCAMTTFTYTYKNACAKFLTFVFRTISMIFDCPSSLDSMDPRTKTGSELTSVYIKRRGLWRTGISHKIRSFPKRAFKQEVPLLSQGWSSREHKTRRAKHRH